MLRILPLARAGHIFVVVVHFADNSDLAFSGVIGVIFHPLLHEKDCNMLGKVAVRFPSIGKIFSSTLPRPVILPLNATINLPSQRGIAFPSKVDLVLEMFRKFGILYYVSFSKGPFCPISSISGAREL